MNLYMRVMAVRRPVVFRVRHLLYGWVYPEITYDPIYINLDRHGNEDPALTYAHECLHILFPKKSEKDIEALTYKLWNSLTPRERFLLSKKLYSRRWRTA